MRALLLLLIVLLITGCTPKLTGYHDSWLDPCPLIPPPEDGVYYKSLTPEEKVLVWVNIYIAQLKANQQCNVRIAKAQDYLHLVKSGKIQ